MTTGGSINELILQVGSFDRDGCIEHLRQMRKPRLDFTDEFLQGQSLDHLRHIVMAAFLQARKSSV
jgi:hypothetical protein